ncbi:hypothetical protein CcCBS67573_g09485 [Chytriomyces confervae]|uniref:G-protein coupled receptors family 1 profile domain-containing protein n=1 Tax=Chytriomyces confervae TaxID=246404 RepID=A0A507DWT0_9FUNG|nr:hypothetical protein CcCBS67573_g09485 [Chytriomyces confervae]
MSNQTLPTLLEPLAHVPALNQVQSMAFALTSGLTIEIACSGLIAAACQFYDEEKVSVSSIITIAFNIATVIYASITVWSNLLVAQIFYVLFDVFMLMKTYAVSAFSPNVLIGCIAVGLYRVSWAVVDIAKSHGYWDPEERRCAYYQYPVSGIGYNSADIIVDVFSTIVALAYNWKHLKTSISQIRKVLIQENLLRSLIILALNSFEIYAALSWTNAFDCTMAYQSQNYIYARCVNAETVFKSIRKKAITQTSVAGASRSKNKSKGGSQHSKAGSNRDLPQGSQPNAGNTSLPTNVGTIERS